jgi:hypothetical protein
MKLPILITLLSLPSILVAAERIRFNQQIRPILSDKCFHCHGPDEKDRKGNLRLDVQSDAFKGGDAGPVAVIPGKPDESLIIKRILETDPDDVMPPPKTHKTVSPQEVALLKQWIAEGAEYQAHWAFLKPERPTPPLGATHPIDAFIRDGLKKIGLKPSPPAAKETLVRRLTLDLTGLAPTPQEIADFVSDSRPNAYEKLVDRLLSSPRYGEHMAASWLDLARYADSNGFQSDTRREMWPWRDWLIKALNANMPFDQFTINQLAGDLLPNATREQILATGFNRNHRLNGEGGRIVEEWFTETVIDRVETTGLAWLGLTFNCCRCHDHKYDPLSQKEFFQLFAYFNSNDELGVMDEFGGAAGTRKGGNSKPVLLLPTPAEEQQQQQLATALTKAQQHQKNMEQQSAELQAKWEAELLTLSASKQSPWKALSISKASSQGGASLKAQEQGVWLVTGANPPNDTYELDTSLTTNNLTGILLEVFPDASLPNQSLGRSSNGNFVLSGIEMEILKEDGTTLEHVSFTKAEADYEQQGWEVNLIIKDQPKPTKKAASKGPKNKSGWAIDGNDPTKRQARKALFLCTPVTIPARAKARIRLIHNSQFPDHNIGKFRISGTSQPHALLSLKQSALPPTLLAALNKPKTQRSKPEQSEIATFFRAQSESPLKQAEEAVRKAKQALENYEGQFVTSMIFRELPTPRQAHVLLRGEYDKIGEPVSRGLPAVLPPLPAGAPNNRLGFAQWLVSPDHPLTARVWVNRAWERFFGLGIVKSTENLGSQADWPSHPELLDWLATEFIQRKWDMKQMMKLIVMSETYQQSSAVHPDHLEKDAENRYLARAPRLRLTGETLRDQALQLSGLLVDRLGGPSVYPYMPLAVWDETSVYGDMRNYQPDKGEGLYRRTLYTVWKRTAAPPSMLLFDSPSREICTVKRSRTNTPLQALALLNEVTYVEAARKLAERMLKEGGTTPAERIAWAIKLTTGRSATSQEITLLEKGIHSRLSHFNKEPEAVQKLLAQGNSKTDPTLKPAEIAAYLTTANVLLNLDEVVTRE